MTMEASPLRYFPSDVPEGTCGPWTIEKITIADRPYDPASDPRPECFKFRPGRYTLLRRGPTQFMTDLYDEWWTQRIGILEAIRRGGDVLITGLGLGLVAEAILRVHESSVRRLTIVEKSEEVIALVAPHLQSVWPDRLNIVHGDAFSWTPSDGSRFSVGWHDIWPDPTTPSIEHEIASLRQHHAGWCEWQGFWPETYQRALADDDVASILPADLPSSPSPEFDSSTDQRG